MLLNPIRLASPVRSHSAQSRPEKFGKQYVYNGPREPLYVMVGNSPENHLNRLNQQLEKLTDILDKRLGDILQILTPVNPPHKDM